MSIGNGHTRRYIMHVYFNTTQLCNIIKELDTE